MTAMRQTRQADNQHSRITFIALLLGITMLLGGCTGNMPAHAPVPEDSLFAGRAPQWGTDRSGTSRRYYTEKYISPQIPADVQAFYEARGASCDVYDSPPVRDLEATIWMCHKRLTDDAKVTLRVYIVSQEEILRDIEQAESEGRIFHAIPFHPADTDPSGETVIIAVVEQ
jgi:hypothetical protein